MLQDGKKKDYIVNKIIYAAISFSIFSFAYANQIITLELDFTNRTDRYTAVGNMVLEGIASDLKTYKIRLSCISKENNRAQGFAIGSLHVYKGPSHVGSKAEFDYDQCLDLYYGLKNKSHALELSWDKEGYDELSSGKLIFSIKEL